MAGPRCIGAMAVPRRPPRSVLGRGAGLRVSLGTLGRDGTVGEINPGVSKGLVSWLGRLVGFQNLRPKICDQSQRRQNLLRAKIA